MCTYYTLSFTEVKFKWFLKRSNSMLRQANPVSCNWALDQIPLHGFRRVGLYNTYIIFYFDTLASSTSAVFREGRVN